ncbi:hypothetical protein [Flavobacterium sasangense]|uniref:hypothetical protein n=1 Tax=Flavobacterium sasangense TaxID=503361 RepID=UPI0012373A2C|nr:hypothetical protein [Flavobacterium sasangense]
MLTFFMWAIVASYNVSKDVELKAKAEFQQKYTPSDFSHFQTVDLEEGEYVTVEIEPELKIEFDVILIPTKSIVIVKSSLEKSSSSYLSQFFSSKEIIPLYDLYCNWKFHLS